MYSKTKKSSRIDQEQREQYDYARKRVIQKKQLMRHFIIFLAGSLLLVIINPVLGIGENFFIKNWFVWAILLWVFLFLIHLLNVFVMNTFMGKDWENRQLEKLKRAQVERMAELQKQVDTELQVPNTAVKKKPPQNPLPPDVE